MLHDFVETQKLPDDRPLITLSFAQSLDGSIAFRELKFMGMHRVLVEGGATIIDRFILEHAVDIGIIFITPIFLGGLHAIQPLDRIDPQKTVGDFPGLTIHGHTQCQNDLVLWGTFKK
jgi:riboflavin biosynthesis pyrimidine reductase